MQDLLCNTYNFMNLLILKERKLFRGNVGGYDGTKMICYDFGNDLIDTIIEGDGSKVIKGARVVSFRDERYEGGVVSLIHSPRNSAIFNDLEKIFTKEFGKGKIEIDCPSIWSRALVFLEPFQCVLYATRIVSLSLCSGYIYLLPCSSSKVAISASVLLRV